MTNYQPFSYDTIKQSNSKNKFASCLFVTLFGMMILCPILGFFLLPFRTNIVFLGIDFAPKASYIGRSDTIILATFIPTKPYIGILSIPRDLWVSIPGVGENRINTAHYFAELESPDTGPKALIETIETNFLISAPYYVRIRFQGVKEIVDAMGGVEINLKEPTAGYSIGHHMLNGNKALAFARNRTGSDDFNRMKNGQLLIVSIIKQLFMPNHFVKLPYIALVTSRSITTNLPWWQIPRLIFAFARIGVQGIDKQVISREMVTPFTTQEGAMVLLPNWERINPLISVMFR